MVDSFLLLTIARTGDQLQGIKKGILELADVVAVNKADGAHERDARAAARELAGALRMVTPSGASWRPPVLACSAQTGAGLDEVWAAVTRHRTTLDASGELAAQARRPAGPVDVGDGARPADGPAPRRPGGPRGDPAAGGGGPRG